MTTGTSRRRLYPNSRGMAGRRVGALLAESTMRPTDSRTVTRRSGVFAVLAGDAGV